MAAADDILLQLKDEVVSCPVCMENMTAPPGDRVPKLLDCLHTLCMKCALDVAADAMLECPECRAVTKLASGKGDPYPRDL